MGCGGQQWQRDAPGRGGVLVKTTQWCSEQDSGGGHCLPLYRCALGVLVLFKPCSVSCHINETERYAFTFPLKLVKMLYFEAGDEIVDLTCESLEPVVVDLTHNDSVVVSGGA